MFQQIHIYFGFWSENRITELLWLPVFIVIGMTQRKFILNHLCLTSRISTFVCLLHRLQDARLEVLKRLLIQRDMKQQELNNKRLDKLWSQKQQSKDEEVEKIRKEHIKSN